MTPRSVYAYTVKVAQKRDNESSVWTTIGTLFYNPQRGSGQENLVLRLRSLPPSGAECRAFPRDGQPAAGCRSRFDLLVPQPEAGAGAARWPFHRIGTVFYNPPVPGKSESFRILFDSYPLTGDLRAYPPSEAAATGIEAADGASGSPAA